MIIKEETKGGTTVELVDHTMYPVSKNKAYKVAVTGKADFVFSNRLDALRKFRVEACKAAFAVARAA